MSVAQYVPAMPMERVRRMESELPPLATRRPPLPHPGAVAGYPPAQGRLQGRTGPDPGYALTLAQRFRGRLELEGGEDERDALAAGAVLGMARAAAAGRAPVLVDVQVGLELLGYLGGAPQDMRTWRRRALQEIRSDPFRQLQLAGTGPEALAMEPGRIRPALGHWRRLLPADLPGVAPAAPAVPESDHEALLTLARKVRAAAEDREWARYRFEAARLSRALRDHLQAEAHDLSRLAGPERHRLEAGQADLGALADELATLDGETPGTSLAIPTGRFLAALTYQREEERRALAHSA